MRRTVFRGLFLFSFLAACGCSDYFMPWTAFQPPDLDPSHYPPNVSAARALNIGDSIGPITLEQGKINWYVIQAQKDSTYVISLYPQFEANIALFDSSDFSGLASVRGLSPSGSDPLIWTCDTTQTVYLRISGYYSSEYGTYSLAMRNIQTVYGNRPDLFELDSRNSRGEIYPRSIGSNETYSIRQLTPGDTDWFYFSVSSGYTYTIRTVGNADTKICLCAETGTGVEATDDNSGGGTNAKLAWVCSSYSYYTRTFYVTGGTDAASGTYGVSIKYSY